MFNSWDKLSERCEREDRIEIVKIVEEKSTKKIIKHSIN